MPKLANVCALLGIAAVGCLLFDPLERPPGEQSLAGAGAGDSNDAGAGGGEPCTSHRDCSHRNGDEPSRCRSDGACVALATDECIVFGDATDDNAVFIGAYGVREGSSLAESTSGYTYRLAIEEFALHQDLPGKGDDRRALVTILCDNDPALLEETMPHLVEDVQVPAILAALDPGVLLEAYRKYGGGRTFFLSPYGGSYALSVEDDYGLIWSMLGQPADFLPLYAELLAKLEALITTGLSGDAPLRVAAIRTNDAFSDELARAVLEGLSFNGVSVATNLDEGNFFVREIRVDAPEAEISGAVTDTVEDILTFEPHVVLSLANEIFVADDTPNLPGGILQSLEAEWGARNPGTSYPYYVLSPKNTERLEERVGTYVANAQLFAPEAHQRFLAIGAAPAEDSELYDKFRVNLVSKFPNASAEAENFYDAFYFLVYAVYAAGQGQLTGLRVSEGMQRLLSRDPDHAVEVGPSGIEDVFRFLSVAGDIRLMGTLGPPDFNLKSGLRVESGAISCFDSNSQVHYNALRFDRDEDDLTRGKIQGDAGLCELPF